MKEPVKSRLIKRLFNMILLRSCTEYVIIEQYCLIRVFNVRKDVSIGGYSRGRFKLDDLVHGRLTKQKRRNEWMVLGWCPSMDITLKQRNVV